MTRGRGVPSMVKEPKTYEGKGIRAWRGGPI